MFFRLLEIVSFYPSRTSPNSAVADTAINHNIPDTIERQYSTLRVPSDSEESEDDDDNEEGDQLPMQDDAPVDAAPSAPNVFIVPRSQKMVSAVEFVDGVCVSLCRALPNAAQQAEENTTETLVAELRDVQDTVVTDASFVRTRQTIALAFIAASPLTRRAVEAGPTDGVVYHAPMTRDAYGTLREPGQAQAAAIVVTVVESEPGLESSEDASRHPTRQPVLSVRVGPIERERGELFTMKTDVEAYDAPYLGYGCDERFYKHYRQLTVHSTCLAPGSVAWRLLEASAWWWRDRRAVGRRTTHPICVASESLEGPVSFPSALFGIDGILQAVRLRSPFVSSPYLVSDAVLDVEALAHAHGAHLTELDLYGACRSVNLVRALASGAFSALVYANLTRTIFSDEAWRAALSGNQKEKCACVVALPCLEELVLDGCHHLRRLDADVFAHMPNLRKLNVFNCTKLKVVADVAACCSYLTQLCASYTHLEKLDLGTVAQDGGAPRPAQAKYLTKVNLQNSSFASLHWLSQTPALETLRFSGFDASEEGVLLEPFVSCHYLTRLTLFCSRLGDLTPLSACAYLEELVLYGVNPADNVLIQNTPFAFDLEPLLLAGATVEDRRPLQRLRRLTVNASGRVRLDYRSDRGEPLVDASQSAVAVTRFKSMLAQPLDSLEELHLEECDVFDDLHTLLTLPSGNEMTEKDGAEPVKLLLTARFPNLKVLDVSGTMITEMDSIVRYCPQLESLRMRFTRHVNIPDTVTTLSALIEEGGLTAEEDEGEADTDRHHRRRACQLRNLRVLECNFMTAMWGALETEHAWVRPLYKALSLICPSLETLRTPDPLPVLYGKKDWGIFPVFPRLTTLSGTLRVASAKQVRNGGLRSALACMFPRLTTAELTLQCVSSPTVNVSPFSCVLDMPSLHTVKGCDLFVGVEALLADPRCSLRCLACWSPSAALLETLQQARGIRTFEVHAHWACENRDSLLALVRSNPALHIRVV